MGAVVAVWTRVETQRFAHKKHAGVELDSERPVWAEHGWYILDCVTVTLKSTEINRTFTI